MSVVKVVYFGSLAQLTGKKEETVDASTVSKVLRYLKKSYGVETYKQAKTSHIIVNGENAALRGGFGMRLQEKDVVRFLPICGGG